jgi:hypothetical protein
LLFTALETLEAHTEHCAMAPEEKNRPIERTNEKRIVLNEVFISTHFEFHPKVR